MLAACGGGSATTPESGWPGHEQDAVAVDYTSALGACTRLNHYRYLASAPPVELDYELSRGCQQHAQYMRLNGILLRDVGLAAHQESPSAPGYSMAGALAAANSVIYQGVVPVEAIDNWMNTLYHRLGLLDPNLQRIGFGSSGDIQVMDIEQGRLKGALAQQAVAVYPVAGMTDVPGEFVREIPYPVPGDDYLGIPITVEFFGPVGLSLKHVGVRLTDLASGQEVPCYLQYPGKPILKGWDYSQLIVLLPADPLVPGRTFQVSIAAEMDGMPFGMQWRFSTK